jgi:hypothetical protein
VAGIAPAMIGLRIYGEWAMGGVPLTDQTRQLVAALRALITPGLYAAALEDSPLVDLPVVTARAGAGAPKTVRAQVFIEVLETVINTRLSKTDQAVAGILFAVGDWSGMSARERHYTVAKLRNKRWTWERNYRKEPLTRDLLIVLRALLREEGSQVPESGSQQTGVGGRSEAQSEAEHHLRRLGRRRTAYPLDMSLEQLRAAGLIVPVRLDIYHERQASRRPGRRLYGLGEIVHSLESGQCVLLLGEPGAGKTLTMYQLAFECAEAGLLPVPLRAREITGVLARPGWRSIRAAHVVVLLDSLDEAIDAITQYRDQFATDLQELLSAGPYVVSSRVREYEELVSGGFPDPGFDVVYAIEPWILDTDFREYLSRLDEAGLLTEPSLYEAVIGSEDLARLVSRPLYARMLTFVGEQAARGLRDHHTLYGEYLARLSLVTEHALESQGLAAGGALAIWQSAAWTIYSAGAGADQVIPLAEVEQRLTTELLPGPVVRRVLDQVIERGSSHGRETGEFIHYSFYEYLVAREVHDRLLRSPGPKGIVDLLKADLPREVRHYLIGQLRMSSDASLKDSLLGSYASVRRVLDIPERDRLLVCNLLIYLVSRVTGSCGDWLRAQLAGEQAIFLRHALLWALCHHGSAWALREFFRALEDEPAMRSECRGYTLYYYGDLSRDDGPPYRDDTPDVTGCSITYRRVIAMFARADFPATVAPERRFIDLYTFLDILGMRGISVAEADKPLIWELRESLRAAGLPATLLARLEQLATRAGLPEQ